jgi:hypothetical protein
MEWKWFADRRTRDRWEVIRRRGHLRHFLFILAIMLGSYALVRLIHIALFRFGLAASGGATTLEDLFFDAILPAIIAAELDWADMRRRFSLKPGENRTMI